MPIASINVSCVNVPDNPRKIRDDEVAKYRADGWHVKPDEIVKQEPVSTPAPVVPVESPLEKIEKAVDAVVDAPKAEPEQKVKRPYKHRR